MRKLTLTALVIAIFAGSLVYVSHYFRESDKEMGCRSSLMSIGQQLKEYGKLHHKPAPDLLTVDPEASSRPWRLECNASGSKYVYLPRLMDGNATTVIAFDLQCMHRNCGCILFGDGHVECVSIERHDAIIGAALQNIINISQSKPAAAEK